MAPSRHDWKIVDWDVKPQHNQKNLCHRYSYSEVSENIINFLLLTVIYLSYVNATIQLSQFDELGTRNIPVQVFWSYL